MYTCVGGEERASMSTSYTVQKIGNNKTIFINTRIVVPSAYYIFQLVKYTTDWQYFIFIIKFLLRTFPSVTYFLIDYSSIFVFTDLKRCE